ncbi:MAG: hypothetical protein J7521_03045 [Caulobacter sp.]|nr:hypothetical protein [Caulobacter sp.]
MKMTVPIYPGGMLGGGLAVLRLSLAAACLGFDRSPDLAGAGQWLLAVLCISMALGAGTRWSALAGALALIALGILLRDLAIVGGMIALVLAGPGAYSIDARVGGRVRVGPRPPR